MYQMKILFIFLILIAEVSAVFQPQDYASDKNLIYVETVSYGKVLKNLRKFYKRLRGAGAEKELSKLATQLNKETGIDWLNANEVRKIGVNIESPFSVTTGNQQTATGVEQVMNLYLPAVDAKKLYTNLITLLQANAKKKPQRAARVSIPATLKEIEPGSLFLYKKNGSTYIAKGESFVLISNTELGARTGLKKSKNPIKNAPYYKLLKNRFSNTANEGDRVLIYTVNPDQAKKLTRSSLQNLPGTKFRVGADSRLIKEMEENLRAMGGSFSLSKNQAQFTFEYIYKDGYLQDQTKLMTKLLSTNIESLSLDYYPTSPVLYGYLKFNLREYLSFIRNIDSSVESEIKKSNKKFKAETGMDLEKDFLSKLQGNFSALLGNLPNENNIRTISAYQGYVSIGYDSGTNKKIDQLLKVFQKKSIKEKQEKVKFIRTSYRNNPLWQIDFKDLSLAGRKPNLRRNHKQPVKPQVTTIFIYLNDKEAVVTTDRSHLGKILLKGKTTLANRLLKIPRAQELKSSSVAYLNIKKIVNYMKQSSMRVLLASYLPFFENINNVNVVSFYKDNIIATEFNLVIGK